MPRQLRNKGGITSIIPREKYGIGSDLKDFVRDIIPNELADVAVKAAPFVAPFYPGTAALMRGIGRFDQRGSISDAIKQGTATYAFGKVAGKLGGAESGEGFFGGQTYSMEGFREGPIGSLFQSQQAAETAKTADDARKGFEGVKKLSDATIGKVPILRDLPPSIQDRIVFGGLTAAASYVYDAFIKEEPPQEEGETIEQYLARRKENVGRKMRTYFDNYFSFDKEYSQLDDAGRDAFVARYNLSDGGRIGYQAGGITMADTLAENIRRNRERQKEFSESLAPTREAVLQGIKAATIAATPKALKGPTTKLYSGTTSATPFGGSKFFATPDLATAKTYATSNPLTRGSPFAGPVTGRILEAEVPTSQAQNLLKKGFSGTREVVLDPQAAKTLFETGKGALKGSGSLATKAAVAGTKALPFVGGAVSLADAALRAKEGDYIGAGLGAAGAVPVLGLPALGAQVLYDKFIKKDKPKEPVPEKQTPLTASTKKSDFQKMLDETLERLRKSHAGQKTATTDLQTDGTYSGIPKEIPIEDYFKGIIAQLARDPAGLNYDPKTGRQLTSTEILERANAAKGGMPTGIMRTNKAGIKERDYRETGGFVPVGIKEKADDVPAMLSKNEFVFTADAVRGAGNGSIEKGAQRMYDTMKRLEKRVV